MKLQLFIALLALATMGTDAVTGMCTGNSGGFGDVNCANGDGTTTANTQNKGASVFGSDVGTCCEAVIITGKCWGNTGGTGDVDCSGEATDTVHKGSSVRSVDGTDVAACCEAPGRTDPLYYAYDTTYGDSCTGPSTQDCHSGKLATLGSIIGYILANPVAGQTIPLYYAYNSGDSCTGPGTQECHSGNAGNLATIGSIIGHILVNPVASKTIPLYRALSAFCGANACDPGHSDGMGDSCTGLGTQDCHDVCEPQPCTPRGLAQLGSIIGHMYRDTVTGKCWGNTGGTGDVNCANGDGTTAANTQNKGASIAGSDVGTCCEAVIVTGKCWGNTGGTGDVDCSFEVVNKFNKGVNRPGLDGLDAATCCEAAEMMSSGMRPGAAMILFVIAAGVIAHQ